MGLWDAQVVAFGPDSTWRYDTRGHGRSDASPGEYSIDRLGQDLLSVIDATGAPQVDVCGLSIGGITALWAAIYHPTRIRRLILANTAARIGDVDLWNERIGKVRAGGLSVLSDATMQRWFTAGFRSTHPQSVDRIRAAFLQTSVDGYIGCCAALRDADVRAQASRVACPTLVIVGAHDPATPPEAGEWIATAVKGAQLVSLDAAHLSNVERPDEFSAAVKTFLA
jgi:3-oxoadipate enol-lactonase